MNQRENIVIFDEDVEFHPREHKAAMCMVVGLGLFVMCLLILGTMAVFDTLRSWGLW